MSGRLNQSRRRAIAHAIINTRFEVDSDKAKQKLHALGDRLYNLKFNKLQRELMGSLPNGWLEPSDEFYVEIDGVVNAVRFSESRPMPANLVGYRAVALQLSSDGKLPADFLKARDAVRDLANARKKALNEVEVVLNSFTSVKTLLREWPEVSEFVISTIPSDAALPNVPAVRLQDLNTRLCLTNSKGKARGKS